MSESSQISPPTGTSQMPQPKDVVVYDGECSFCISQINTIRKLDSGRVFEYVPRQSPDLNERFSVLKGMDFEEGMRFVARDGSVAIGADAIYQIGRRLPSTSWFVWLYNLPVCHQVARAAYKWIAANRKRLGKTCDNGLCKVGTQDSGEEKPGVQTPDPGKHTES